MAKFDLVIAIDGMAASGKGTISKKIAQLLTPDNINAKVNVIYQSISDLHISCPDHQGDWYFTGKYPTLGGNRVVNKSFINYIEGRNERAY